MKDRTLPQSQKNQVFGITAAAQMPPSAFQWLARESSESMVSMLEHTGSKFFYVFDYGYNTYEAFGPVAHYSPGLESRAVTEYVGAWEGQLVIACASSATNVVVAIGVIAAPRSVLGATSDEAPHLPATQASEGGLTSR